MRKSNVSLRLHPSLLDQARLLAQQEGVALNQLINVAVAEKVAALKTVDYLRERAKRGDPERTLAWLKSVGQDVPPAVGDKLE